MRTKTTRDERLRTILCYADAFQEFTGPYGKGSTICGNLLTAPCLTPTVGA